MVMMIIMISSRWADGQSDVVWRHLESDLVQNFPKVFIVCLLYTSVLYFLKKLPYLAKNKVKVMWQNISVIPRSCVAFFLSRTSDIRQIAFFVFKDGLNISLSFYFFFRVFIIILVKGKCYRYVFYNKFLFTLLHWLCF